MDNSHNLPGASYGFQKKMPLGGDERPLSANWKVLKRNEPVFEKCLELRPVEIDFVRSIFD